MRAAISFACFSLSLGRPPSEVSRVRGAGRSGDCAPGVAMMSRFEAISRDQWRLSALKMAQFSGLLR
jgi:hypothetical protein